VDQQRDQRQLPELDGDAVRMKILLFGKNGQVGRELQRTLLSHGDVDAVERSRVDLCDSLALWDILQTEAPDLIVNAAAYTAVDRAESDEDLVFRVNAEAVGMLARFAYERRALLIHYSTDYVFDGEKRAPYVESDATGPLNVYGSSKLAGELAIDRSGCDALIFRTSWVYSAAGSNFIKTILRLAGERDHLGIVADQFGAPTSAELIADVTSLAISAYRRGALSGGLYHLAARGETTWHGLARYVVEKAIGHGAKFRLTVDDISPIGTNDYPLPARRPANSCLDTSALAAAAGLKFPDWKIHVDRMLDQLSSRETAA
jgi:dTDP-4-dehydrorhamnose reductase